MQIIRIEPLIERFRAGTFKDEEVAPYFFAYVILEAVAWTFAYGEADPWSVGGSIAAVIIAIFGTLYLKKCNRGSFGNGFLNKYFALGWVITVRMILIVFPVAVVLFAVASNLGSEKDFAVVGAILSVVGAMLFYWWLGVAFTKAQQQDSQHVLPPPYPTAN